MYRSLRLKSPLIVAAVTAVLGIVAIAITITVPLLISGPDPLPPIGSVSPPNCGSPPKDRDWEWEPSLAVNPANRSNLITAWIQDYDDGIVAAYSPDGGNTWQKTVVPTSLCTGGPPPLIAGDLISSYDPSVSFGPNGTAYLAVTRAELRCNDTTGCTPAFAYSVVVHVWDNARQTWSQPHVIDQTGAIDRSTLVADPTQPGRAYVSWAKGADLTGASVRPFISSTTDGGNTWSTPIPIYNPIPAGSTEPNHIAAPNQLMVLSDGTLVAIIGDFPSTPGVGYGETTLKSIRSVDHGVTWSAPAVIAQTADTHLTFSTSAVAPDGTIYVSWQRTDANFGRFELLYSKSIDGGASWQPEQLVGAAGTKFGFYGNCIQSPPNIAVANDGTIGVLFYDHRNDTTGAFPAHTTDLWIRLSHDQGLSWEDQHVAGPFDQTTAPENCGGIIGDYQSLVAVPGGFLTAFTAAKNMAQLGGTDIFVSKINLDVSLSRVVSRKSHDGAGTFDVDLPQTGRIGIEPRDGTGKGVYTIVFTFANPLASVGGARVTNGSGTIANSSIGADRRQYVVNLSGVKNAQRLTVTLDNVTDTLGDTSSSVSATMGVLIGDVNGDGIVDNADANQVKSQLNQKATASNFRDDVTFDGTITGNDYSLVKSKIGTRLP